MFTRKKEPVDTTQSLEADPVDVEADRVAAEREEIESLLGHKSVSNGIQQNGRTNNV